MLNKTGFIEGVSKDGKRFKMGEDWFSAFASSQMNGCAKGDYVSFTYTEKPSPTGDVYRNVKGNLTKATPPADAPVTAAKMFGKSSGGFVAKEFPVPPFHPDRSIIRQNSLAHATDLINAIGYGYIGGSLAHAPTAAEYAERIIEVARMFEAYSSGDLDVAIVEEEMRALTAKET